ncbi:MAG: TlpA disulfide reductase family protein, partial [Bacteroidota bacterium]
VIDSSNNGKPYFVGDLSAENNYLNTRSDLHISKLNKGIFDLSDLAFQTRMDSSLNEAKLHLIKLEEEHENLSSNFINLETGNLEYNHKRNILSYFNQGRENGKEVGALNMDFMDNPGIGNIALLSSKHFKEFIFEFANTQYKKVKADETYGQLEKYQKRYELINSLVDVPKIQDILKTNLLSNAINTIKTIEINPLYDTFMQENTNERQLNLIKRTYQKNIPLTRGAYAPEIIGVTTGGDEVKLSDLKGKYVYIFVWATWCGPCKTEMPAYEHMVDQYGSDNIVFLGISVDKNKKNWQESFIYNKYPGMQILVAGDWDSPMIKNYKLQSVPQFIFIDPNGKVVSLNAPAPTKGGGNYVRAHS